MYMRIFQIVLADVPFSARGFSRRRTSHVKGFFTLQTTINKIKYNSLKYNIAGLSSEGWGIQTRKRYIYRVNDFYRYQKCIHYNSLGI